MIDYFNFSENTVLIDFRCKMPYKKSDINQPSTSKAHKDITSPISPTGRIAKRNARLMNGMFLGPTLLIW